MKRSLCALSRTISGSARIRSPVQHTQQCLFQHSFHSTPRWLVVKPFVLADIGEGIREVQIIQWFVQPGARVEQFDKICEVASDKAIVEITSRFDGVIKKLHYEPDAMAQVGKPLCDIDIQGEVNPADENLTTSGVATSIPLEPSSSLDPGEQHAQLKKVTKEELQPGHRQQTNGSKKATHLATPAVRGLLKEYNLDIMDIQGTGRDGRVLKEDIHTHLSCQISAQTGNAKSQQTIPPPPPPTSSSSIPQTEVTVSMTPIQTAMFKSMTRSLSIPHFLYSDDVDMTELSALRSTINTSLSSQKPPPTQGSSPFHTLPQAPVQKLSYLPYIIKAVSLALTNHPILNATLLTKDTSNSTPKLLHRPSHNIGIAMDTPSGLLVPIIKNVQSLTILEIAHHLQYLQFLAASNKLTSHPDLLSGGTITISNIGNIGGGVLSPVLVEGQSAILGIGKAKELPRFADNGEIQRRLIAMFSWTADHRVLDGATVARFADEVAGYVTAPGRMVAGLR